MNILFRELIPLAGVWSRMLALENAEGYQNWNPLAWSAYESTRAQERN